MGASCNNGCCQDSDTAGFEAKEVGLPLSLNGRHGTCGSAHAWKITCSVFERPFWGFGPLSWAVAGRNLAHMLDAAKGCSGTCCFLLDTVRTQPQPGPTPNQRVGFWGTNLQE